MSHSAINTWWGSLITEKTDPSGYKYMRNRYYNPQTGQFTQSDPIGLAGGVNLYGYAGGDPVNFSDPFGLSPCLVMPTVCNAVAGAAIGAAVDAGLQLASNVASDRPVLEGVGEAALEGAAAGAVLGGVGSAVRIARAVSKAEKAGGFEVAKVWTRGEAEAAGRRFAGKSARPIVERRTGRPVGLRDDATGRQYRTTHTDGSVGGQPHTNLQNAAGGNTHVVINSWWKLW